MLLISRSGLVEEDVVEVFQYYGFYFFLDVKFQVLAGKIIMWWYSRFLSTSSCRRSTCGTSAFKDSFSILKTRNCPEL